VIKNEMVSGFFVVLFPVADKVKSQVNEKPGQRKARSTKNPPDGSKGATVENHLTGKDIINSLNHIQNSKGATNDKNKFGSFVVSKVKAGRAGYISACCLSGGWY